jgi:bacillithiol system protein YtxJ
MKSFLARILSGGSGNSAQTPGIGSDMADLPAILRRERPDLAEQVDQVSTYLIYKHSPWCGLSQRAEGEVTRFRAAEPDIPVVQVDVIHEASLSAAIEAGLHVRHESPQAILIQDGRVAWHDSHGRVTAAHLQAAVRALSSGHRTA